MKKGFVITAAIMTAAGLLLCTGALIAAGFDPARLDSAKYVTNTYAPEGVFDRIEISSKEGDILFKPAGDGRCTVVCVERERMKHRVVIEDGTLTISAEDEREWYDHLSLFSKHTSVTVYLPADRYESLTLRGSTGDVSLPDPFTFGQIDAAVSTGDITCAASVEGLLRIRGSTGNVTLKDLSAGKTDIALSTGDVTLRDLDCQDLFVKSSTGEVKLKNVIAVQSLHIETDTGDVTFDSCDAGQIQVSVSTGDVTGTLRSRKRFITKTSTGSVKVPDPSEGGRCEITTSTGDIEIEIKE